VAERQRRPGLALEHARLGVEVFDRAREHAPDDPLVRVEQANALAWLGDAQAATGDFVAALASHGRATAISLELEAAAPGDMGLAWLAATRIRGEAHALNRAGHGPAARTRMAEAANRLARLVRHDPANREWRKVQLKLAGEQIRLAAGSGLLATVPPDVVALAAAAAGEPLPWQPGERALILAFLGQLTATTGDTARGVALLDRAAAELRNDLAGGADVRIDLLEVELLRHDLGLAPALATLAADVPGADDPGQDWRRAPVAAAAWMTLGKPETARPLVRRLLAGGYAEPGFMAGCRAAALCPAL
jgi:hypothetical protein